VTKQQIKIIVDKRIKEGTAFSREELTRTYTMNNPPVIIKDKIIEYAEEYNIDIKDKNSKLYKIFQNMIKGKRFIKEDIIWLENKHFFHEKLKLEYHKREADYYEKKYLQDKDLWNIVNASSQYRKARLSKKSIKLVNEIAFKNIKENRLKSALIVSQGGAYRDIKKLDKAFENAQKGFSYDNSSFHPCTLYGALYYETGKYALGEKWFSKAIENGAKVNNVNSEITSIFKRTKGKEREKLKKYLDAIDKSYLIK
jgi:tetratricopeptide (TPR) repeat protein